jgi:uncharacterized protein
VRLEHQFSVPAPPDVVWAAVIDPARVAPCMPGATLAEVDGAEFSGVVKVKVGPISLLYKGTGQFLETDEQARRVVIKAAGRDSRGNGTAAATVTVTLTEEPGGTRGTVVTDLTINGKPAQFGRGMIVEVGGKILDEFAACLAGKLDTSTANGVAATPKPAAKSAAAKSKPTAVTDEADVDDTAEEPPPQVKPKPATRRRTSTKTTTRSKTSAPADAEANGEVPAAALTAELPTTQELAAESSAAPRLQLVSEPEPAPEPIAPAPVASETEAIDLLDYAGPSVAKRLIPAVVGVILLILFIRRLRRR